MCFNVLAGYNDWRTAHQVKIQRLRETMQMFGDGNRHAHEHAQEEQDVVDEIHPEQHGKKKKTRKKHKSIEEDADHLEKLPDL